MAYKVPKHMRNDFRRLTQLANRRVKAFTKHYEKGGQNIIPKAVTAGFDVQSRKQWFSEKYAFSRSVKFESKKDYQEHMAKLRKFDNKQKIFESSLNVTEYTALQQDKIASALNTSGVEIDMNMYNKINSMTAVELSKFWATYERIGRRMGLQYNSEAAMSLALDEFMSNKDVEIAMKLNSSQADKFG